MRWLAVLLFLWCGLVSAADRFVSWTILPERPVGLPASPIDAHDFAPYIEIESPLYRAIINRETRCCVWITFRVRAEDVENDNETDRVWWLPPELRDFCLEAEDYRGSGYDRGHLRSIQMSRGSGHWQDVNLTAVIVPELPELNRGAISQLESHICDLATSHGWADVTITLTGDAGDMPRADESHAIPERLLYVVESPAGREEVEFSNVEGN